MKYILLLIYLMIAFHVKAQLPQTTIYLFDVQRNNRSIIVHNPKLISKKKGYNNQPNFTLDDKYLFYTSSVDSTNTEIYKIDLGKKKRNSKRITKTKQPEYSPKYTPDMEHISCVRVENDSVTQHLSIYSMKGKPLSVVNPDLKSIGYYEWINQNQFLSFELPEPFYLVKHTISTQKKDTLAKNIGRTFYFQQAKSRIVYLDKLDSNKWDIRFIEQKPGNNLKGQNQNSSTFLSETLPHEEDYCFMMDGSILMGHEGILYIKKNPFRNPNATWDELCDLKKFGIHKFYRITISRDNTMLAVVAFANEKP